MKQFFYKTLFRIRKFLAIKTLELARNLNEPILKEEIEENPPILSMAPKVLLDEKELKLINPYLSQLKKAMLDKDIFNIAITGNYGSGKSTIIKTFRHQNPQFNYLNISLASFKEESDNNELEKKLEISILQQIFYHVDPSKIPDSKFKRIKTYSWGKLGLISSSLIIWIYSLYAIINFDLLKWLNPVNWNFDQEFEWLTFLFYSIFISGIIFIMKDIIRIWSNSKINKVNIKGELEIGEKTVKSVFNEHLEEILYFFEKTNFNTVIFEDLDRFKNTQIFTKLREINTLLNNFETIKNKRKIKFIYAVKDEVLTDKTQRVKFFDLIIPVIPFINQSNASEQLTNLIQKNGLENTLSTEFTNDVISFINDIDMRLLINIFLEYKIFKESMSNELNQDTLFALVTYKNIYPKDFSLLYSNQGSLFNFVNNKHLYIKDLQNQFETDLDIINQEISKLENESIKEVETLMRIYLIKIIELYPNIYSFESDRQYEFAEFFKESRFEDLVDNKFKFIQVHRTNGYSGKDRRDFSFKNIENNIDPLKSYKERRKIIEDNVSKKLISLKENALKIKFKIEEIENFELFQIFEILNISDYTNETTNDNLVKNLIINGYINENYRNYISLFHEISISQNDFNFLNSVVTGGILPFSYKVDKVENLIKKISIKYFKRSSILNFQILDELLTHENFDVQKNYFFLLLSSESKDVIKFIYQYINREKNLDKFFYYLCFNWKGFWESLLSSDFPNDTIDIYLKYIIEFANIEDIIKFNSETNRFGDYIIDRGNFFSIVCDNNDKNKVKKILDKLDLKFLKLEKLDSGNQWIYDYVYDNNYYEINTFNLKILLNDSFNEKSIFTSVINSDLLQLEHYVRSNINYFVNKVLLMNNDPIQESTVAFLDLLNNLDLKIDLKFKLIQSQVGFIESLSEISNLEVKKLLLEELKVIPYWMNIFDYYNSFGEEIELDDVLLAYLNSPDVYRKLEGSKINSLDNVSIQEIENLSEKILESSDLSYESFKALRNSIPFGYEWLDYDKLSEEKVKYSIESKLVYLDVEGAKKLSETYPDLRIILFESYQMDFLKNFSDLDVSSEEILQLLDSNGFDSKNKFELVKIMNQNLLIEDQKIARRSCDILANFEFYPLNFSQLEFMFKFNFNWENKMKMLIKHFETLQFDEVQILSKMLSENGHYSKIFQKQNKPTFYINDLNKAFFELLERKSFIKRFEINPKNKDEYRVIANY